MENREHDIMLDMLYNQEMTLGQLQSIGMKADNTSLQDRQKYQDNAQIQLKFLDSNGNFDIVAYNNFYDTAKAYYNLMANTAESNQVTYHRDNIFAPESRRRKGPDFTEVSVSNPYQISKSVIELGAIGNRTQSIDELAQANKVLLNPTTAGENLENAKWGDTPNNNFFGYFLDTLVLAQYDSDGTHINPITKETEEHSKGDLKLDDAGNFYYEKLDGRDIYNRRVLNKMNVLTVDGSFANKFDFFDSDDITQKSLGGSLLKNAALVGTMFIPYIGPWVAGASAAVQLAGFGATLGKMLVGSDSPNLSAIEGWAKSMNRQGAVTEEAAQNPWAMENWINLIGDVAGLLKEQRFIFEKVPALFKGGNALSETSQAKKLDEFLKLEKQLADIKIKDLNKGNVLTALKAQSEASPLIEMKAKAKLRDWVKDYNKFGEIASKGYMTLLTTADTYGEAKASGASDLDATLLTLGHAMGEWAILNTGLGEWILPEIRQGKIRSRAIVDALTELNDEATKTTFKDIMNLSAKEGKKLYLKKALELGKKIARAEYATGERSIIASGAAAIGEGFEEVSEELLADFSKGCYDVVKWLLGDDTRINTFGYDFEADEWNSQDVLTRYGMSAIGGFIGGGLTNAGTNYKMMKSLSNMTLDEAVLELVYMARNGELKDFLRDVDKMDLGRKHLSTKVEKIDGVNVFAPGTELDNLDLYIKRAVRKQAEIIQNIIDANGARVSDDSILAGLTEVLKDIRFNILHKTPTAGAFIKEFNRLTAEVVKDTAEVNRLETLSKDLNNDGTVTYPEVMAEREKEDQTLKKLLKEAKDRLSDHQKQLKEIIDGKRSVEFIQDSLFDAIADLSSIFTFPTFNLYAEYKSGKKFNELSDNLKETYRREYETWSTTERASLIHTLSGIYRLVELLLSDTIKAHIKEYLDSGKEVSDLHNLFQSIYSILELSNSAWLQRAQRDLSNPIHDKYLQKFISEEDKEELNRIYEEYHNIPKDLSEDDKVIWKQTHEKEYNNKTTEVLKKALDNFINPFIERGFANTETKTQLINIINYLIPKSTRDEKIKYVELRNKIENLNNTPIEENLNQLSIVVGNGPINLSALVKELGVILNNNRKDLSNFKLEEDTYQTLKNAILTLKMYKAAIKGARTDGLNYLSETNNDVFGYNATLNRVQKEVNGEDLKLVEIDSNTADLFLEDIQNNLSQLEFLETLYDINMSSKLGKQDNVATKKSLIVYKRMKEIINVPDDDPLRKWKGFKLLKEAINGMSMHSELSDKEDISIPIEKRVDFQKEIISLEDAIYNFFNMEDDAFTNIEKLKLFVNANLFNMYTKGETLLNEKIKSIDDSAMLWYIAGRAALKSTDFYNEFKQIIDVTSDDPIAPIATLEMAIYTNYASIVNGDVFSAFGEAIKQSMLEQWGTLSPEQRKNLLIQQGELEPIATKFSKDSYVSEAINFIPIPIWQNIVLTEGIPGSGKSAAVFKMTIELLKKFHPDHEILKNIYILYGAGETNEAGEKGAKRIADTCGLPEAKCFGKEKGILQFSSEWKKHSVDSNGNLLIDDSEIGRNEENRIESILHINDSENTPSLIIIDEVSHFTTLDLDIIQKYALKYGITVLVAGDFDQSGVTGVHNVTISGKTEKKYATQSRNNHIRNIKLGISMRTDNSIKSSNIQRTQTWMQNPNESLILDYFEDDSGLYGDYVILFDDNGDGTFDQETAVAEIEDRLDALISTLKPGEKIGYIYDNESSEINELLSEEKYAPFITKFKGTGAQGFEGQYYIIDLLHVDDTLETIKNIYTGLSRAELGSIIAIPKNLNTKSSKKIEIKSTLATRKIDEHIDKLVLKKYAELRKKVLDEVVKNGNKVEIKPRNRSIKPEVSKPEPEGPTLNPALAPIEPPKTEEIKPKFINAIEKVKTIDELDGLLNTKKDDPILRDPDVIEAIKKKYAELSGLPEIKIISIDDIPTELHEALQKYLAKFIPTIEDDLSGFKCGLLIGNIVEVQHESGNYYGIITNIEKISDNNFNITVVDPNTLVDDLDGNEVIAKYEEPINNIVSVVKDIEEFIESTPTEPSEYTDSGLPVPTDDTENDEIHRLKIDSENADNSKSVVSNTGIKILQHSYNTHELGMGIDNDGYPVPIGGDAWGLERIDSINGLLKIDEYKAEQAGEPFKRKTAAEYSLDISECRSALFNIENKEELCKWFENKFGLSGIFITFAYKKSALPGEENKANGKTYVGNTPNPFEQGLNESTLFNGSSDLHSSDINREKLVAIIGTKETGNILELPLLVIASPITLLNQTDAEGQFVFPDVYNYWKEQRKTLGIYQSARAIISEFYNSPQYKNNPAYKTLIDRFRNFVVSDNLIRYVSDNDWTPAKNMEMLGPLYELQKGIYQETEGYSYDAGWTPLNELVSPTNYEEKLKHAFDRNTNFVFSSILVAQSDNIDGVDNVVKRGHCFVLASNDLTLNTDDALVNRWILEQKNPKINKKVKLVYVAAPKGTFEEYIESKHSLLKDNTLKSSLGSIFTPYKIWDAILNCEDVDFKNKFDEFIKEHPSLQKVIPTITEIINNLNSKDDFEKISILNSSDLWEGFPNSKTVAAMLDMALHKLCYGTIYLRNSTEKEIKRNDVIKLISNILYSKNIDGIYHRVKLGKNPVSVGPFVIPDVGPNYTLDGKPFMIHGKLDSCAFISDLTWLFGDIDSWTYLKNGHLHSYDEKSYMYDKNSNLNKEKKKPGRPKVTKSKVLTKCEELLEKYTGNKKDLSRKTDEEALDFTVNELNYTGKTIAFRIGKDIIVGDTTNNQELFEQVYSIRTVDGHTLTNIQPLKTTIAGQYIFKVITQKDSYLATYENNVLTLTKEINPESIIVETKLNVPEIIDGNRTDFENYAYEAINLFENVEFNSDLVMDYPKHTIYSFFAEGLMDSEILDTIKLLVLNDSDLDSQDYVNALNKLKEYDKLDRDDLIQLFNDLLNHLGDNITDIQLKIIDDFINVLKEESEEPKEACSLTDIKIKMN